MTSPSPEFAPVSKVIDSLRDDRVEYIPHPSTILRWAEKRLIRAQRIGDRRWLVCVQDVRAMCIPVDA